MMGKKTKAFVKPKPRPAAPEASSIALCDARCKSCRYSGMIFRNDPVCEYLDLRAKRHMRPCPAGAECTVYEPRKARKNAHTPPIWQKLLKEDKDG